MDHLHHRSGADRVLVGNAVLEIGLKRLDGPWHGRRRRRVERGRMPALHLAAGEGLVLYFRAELVARRMTGAAMPESLHQIGAAIPLGAARGVGPEDAALEIAGLPEADARARQRHGVAPVLLLHRLARHDEGIERGDVLVRQLGEMVVRERREEMPAFAVDAFAHRARKGRERPAADAGLGVRRDVGAIDGAERRLERRATGVGLAALGGVAAQAVADVGELLALGDLLAREGFGRIDLRHALARGTAVQDRGGA